MACTGGRCKSGASAPEFVLLFSFLPEQLLNIKLNKSCCPSLTNLTRGFFLPQPKTLRNLSRNLVGE